MLFMHIVPVLRRGAIACTARRFHQELKNLGNRGLRRQLFGSMCSLQTRVNMFINVPVSKNWDVSSIVHVFTT